MRVTRFCLLLCLWACASAYAGAQGASEPELKAAFVANFAKFTQWPAQAVPQGAAFTFCVIGDRDVAAALERAIEQHPSEAAMHVVVAKPGAALPSCQLLYAGKLDSEAAARVLDATKGAAVFTVSDSEKFAERGGVAQLFVENGRMRFAINPAAAQRAGLSLSAKLLNLARVVREG